MRAGRNFALWATAALAPLLGACGEDADAAALPRDLPEVVGEALDAPVTPTGLDAAIAAVAQDLVGEDTSEIEALDRERVVIDEEGVTGLAWRDLSLRDEPMDDILDAMLYPEEYEEGEFELPAGITALDGAEVAIVGYQIPLRWEDTTIPEFMLVGDLLGCCFGGSPSPDQWIQVEMQARGADYFYSIPVLVRGTFQVSAIEDEAGYAYGCYHIRATSVEQDD